MSKSIRKLAPDFLNSINGLEALCRLLRNLSRSRRRQIFFLFCAMVFGGFIEFVALNSFLPIFSLLTKQEAQLPSSALFPGEWMQTAVSPWVHDGHPVVFWLILFALLFVLSSVFRVGIVWFASKLSNSIGSDLGVQMIRKALYQPYQAHFSENTSILISGITQQVAHAVFAISSMLTLLLSVVMTTGILAAMVVGSPRITFFVFGALATAYLILISLFRPILDVNSRIIAKKQAEIIKILQEALGGIRDVLVNGSQEFFGKLYQVVDAPLRKARVQNTFLIQSPRYFLEGLAVPSLAIISVWIIESSGNILQTFSILGLLARQKNIAHVPQSIFLIDGSFKENIAFGETQEEINLNKVKKSAAIADLDALIEKSENGFETNIGERGVRLSGGQRQRLGIARALYRQAPLLILDEATSALDIATEDRIIEKILNMSPPITVLMVTHRKRSLRGFSKRYKIEPTGRLVKME